MFLKGKRIVLGVTGGIAAYKAVYLLRLLQKAGSEVNVIMTEAATHFVGPLTFQSLSRRPVAIDMFQLHKDMDIAHVSFAHWADAIVIAPATANTIAKLAMGLADNLLTSTVLDATCPVVVAPAMESNMWSNPATAENIERLRRRGFFVVGPEAGELASGGTGLGRMAEPEAVLGCVRYALSRDGVLRGRSVVVTAGPTREAIDPVRFISNRSSGKMGYALAQAALDLGADVTLVSGPVHLAAPYGVQLVAVETVAQMQQAVLEAIQAADALIMAAAPVDYRAEHTYPQKVKKEETGDTWQLRLVRNPDILSAVALARPSRLKVLVGFAAETEELVANALLKLERKGLDLIVANDVSARDAGFGVDTNRVVLIDRRGGVESWPLLSKEEVAMRLMQRVAELLLRGE